MTKAVWAKPCHVAARVEGARPQPVRRGRAELPPHPVRRTRQGRVLDRGLHRAAAHGAAQPHGAHQPLHRASGHRDALAARRPPDRPRAVRARRSRGAARRLVGRGPRPGRGRGGTRHGRGRHGRGGSTGRSAAAGRSAGRRGMRLCHGPRTDGGTMANSSTTAIIASVGGRALPARTAPRPSSESRRPDAARGSRARGRGCARAPRSSLRGARHHPAPPGAGRLRRREPSRGGSPPCPPPQPHRRGPRRVLALGLAHHPHRALAQLGRVRRSRLLASQEPHPPKAGASGNAGRFRARFWEVRGRRLIEAEGLEAFVESQMRNGT